MLVEISMNNCAKYQNQTYIFFKFKKSHFSFCESLQRGLLQKFFNIFSSFFWTLLYLELNLKQNDPPPPPVLNWYSWKIV